MIIKRKQKILFINGFSSQGKKEIYNSIQNCLPEYKILYIELDEKSPINNFNSLKDLIKKENIDIIIGFSMGGFYAELLDNVSRKIFINPAFRFYEISKKYPEKFDLGEKAMSELKYLSNNYRFKTSYRTKSVMIIGKFDYKILQLGVIKDYNNNYKDGRVFYYDGKHVIDKDSIYKLIPKAIKILN